jgi:hypothetical protein
VQALLYDNDRPVLLIVQSREEGLFIVQLCPLSFSFRYRVGRLHEIVDTKNVGAEPSRRTAQ